jgi:hypothetical protein
MPILAILTLRNTPVKHQHPGGEGPLEKLLEELPGGPGEAGTHGGALPGAVGREVVGQGGSATASCRLASP